MTSTVPAPVARTADDSALQAVLLDMDGTLVDTEGFWWEIEAEIFRELGHLLEDSWRDIVVGGPMSRSAAFLIESTGAAIGIAELSVLLNERFEARIADQVPMMPGAERLLAELARHNVPTALVSASHRRVIDQVLRTLGRDRFTMTVAGDEVPRTKPHPDPYLFAARSLGAHPSRCAVIEDTATGVAAAEAAGCRVVAIPSVGVIAPAPGRTIVRSLEEVDLPFLRSLITPMN
ncbi:hydrolase [Streptomyces sp. WM4235]|uniref:HAD family hydrolase n=1 Tax=unclassified Streptomyces TaxID=2593676 RepID=UPI0006ADB1DE|nr:MULTISPECIES: HAD family phosphatase [unclassified Streptomyces]KOU54333.1 hydrolase [Streptomyces sp. WM4235]MCX5076293.1 HAD family phosphatase [Streptomyces sp. NBC_00424]WUD40663.1 HAD family phosphatase [Streptomyces sp. NBC_00513]